MTRWARAKSAHQHCKQPENATLWAEYSAQRNATRNINSSYDGEVESLKLETSKGNIRVKDKKLKKKFKRVEKGLLKKKIKKLKPFSPKKKRVSECEDEEELTENNLEIKDEELMENSLEIEDEEISDEEMLDSKLKIKNKLMKKKMKKPCKKKRIQKCEGDDELTESYSELKKMGGKKLKIKRKKMKILPSESNENDDKMEKENDSDSQIDESVSEKSKEKVKNKRDAYRGQQVCFCCRKAGHLVADCPTVKADNEQGTGICFKCGSTEHIARRCSVKVNDYPYAKCFLCGGQGHIARNCTTNEKGLYPFGGSCKQCGANDHFRRECPELKDSDALPNAVLLPVMTKGTSADAEIDDDEQQERRKKKKVKTVKF